MKQYQVCFHNWLPEFRSRAHTFPFMPTINDSSFYTSAWTNADCVTLFNRSECPKEYPWVCQYLWKLTPNHSRQFTFPNLIKCQWKCPYFPVRGCNWSVLSLIAHACKENRSFRVKQQRHRVESSAIHVIFLHSFSSCYVQRQEIPKCSHKENISNRSGSKRQGDAGVTSKRVTRAPQASHLFFGKSFCQQTSPVFASRQATCPPHPANIRPLKAHTAT